MESEEQPAHRELADAEETWIVEGSEAKKHSEQAYLKEVKAPMTGKEEPKQKTSMLYFGPDDATDKRVFVNGLSVGLGIGCITTFVIMWVAVFFTPQLPSNSTYEDLLSIFIYPMIYLLTVGLIALTAGIVREYYAAKFRP